MNKKIFLANQEKVWNKISKPWKTFRAKPLKEAVDFLNNAMKNKRGNIVDLGCGSGRNFVKLNDKRKGKAKSKIYAVDFSRQQLEYAREYAKKHGFNVKTIKAFAYSLPFKDNFFDAAIFIAALHCIPQAEKRKKALQELKRVMKKGASAMITVWDKNQPRFKNSEKEALLPWKHEGKKYMRYYYLYDKNELLELLKDAGFKIKKVFEKSAIKGLYSSRNIVVIVRK